MTTPTITLDQPGSVFDGATLTGRVHLVIAASGCTVRNVRFHADGTVSRASGPFVVSDPVTGRPGCAK